MPGLERNYLIFLGNLKTRSDLLRLVVDEKNDKNFDLSRRDVVSVFNMTASSAYKSLQALD